jgi:hypothetical protein
MLTADGSALIVRREELTYGPMGFIIDGGEQLFLCSDEVLVKFDVARHIASLATSAYVKDANARVCPVDRDESGEPGVAAPDTETATGANNRRRGISRT